jgi:hypothetical protein
MKCFSFTLKQVDPITDELIVDTNVFKLEGGNLIKLSGPSREFTEEDIVDFDREIGAIAGISANDLLHGDSSIHVEEIVVQPPAKLLKVVRVKRKKESLLYLLVTEVLANGEERVLYVNHRSLRVKLNEAVREASRILGVDESSIWNILE